MKNWKNNFNKGAPKVTEPTELEKLQQEFNNTSFQLGNAIYKRDLLYREETELKKKMEELSVKAAALMKQKAEEEKNKKPEGELHILPVEEPASEPVVDEMAAPV